MTRNEVVTVADVHCEGLYLRVNDGRMLIINSEDAACVSGWTPDTDLTIRATGGSGMFNLELQREESDPPIRASWL